MMDVQIKQFREILFWPLEIPNLSRRLAPDEAKLCTSKFEATLASQDTWKREESLLLRGDDTGIEVGGQHYAEWVFFHPFVQRFLYPRSDEKHPPLRLYRRSNIRKVRVELWENAPPVEFDVDRIHLYLFDHGVALLVVEVHATTPLSLKQVEEFLDRFRRAYPPYWKSDKNKPFGSAGHCPHKVEWLKADGVSVLAASDYQEANGYIDFVARHKAAVPARHWQYLLSPLTPWKTGLLQDTFAYRQIEDERMPFMAYLSLDDPSHLRRGDFVRLCFADEEGHSLTLPYAPGFLENFEKAYCYDRYWDTKKAYCENPADKYDTWMTTRYLCCGYGFVMIGKDDEKSERPFYSDGINGALSHFRRHYFQMGLVAHFHRAALLLFSDGLSEAVGRFESDKAEFHREVNTVLERLLRFTHRYWFREVSNQVQPRELFALWTRHLETQALFDQVKQEAQDAHNFLEMQAQKKLAEATMRLSEEQTTLSKAAVRLSVVATLGLPAGLIAAFLAIDWDKLDGLWPTRTAFEDDFPAVLMVALAVFAGLFLIVWKSEWLAELLDKIASLGKKPSKN